MSLSIVPSVTFFLSDDEHQVGSDAMKDSGIEWIGSIPKDWEVKRLQFGLVEINVKNNPVQTTQVLSLMKDVGVLPYEEKGDVGNKSKENVSEYHLAFPNTIVLNCMNILIGSVGISKYFGCVSPVYYVFKETDESDLRFINYIFATTVFQKELRKYANGILEIRLRVSSFDIFKRQVPFPPKSEQHVIADYLDSKCAEVDALRNDIEKQIALLEQYKKSVITEAVTKGLHPDVEMRDTGIEWIGEIPKDWDIIKIGGVYSLRNTKVSDFDYQPLSVTMKGILSQLETAAKTNDHENRKLVRKGDFAINSRSDRRGSCGISDYDGSVSLINTVLKPHRTMVNGYYNWLFHTIAFADEFYKWGHGIVDDLWTTNWQDMKKIFVPYPSVDVQISIADYLDFKCAQIDEVIVGKKKQLEALDSYKKSLIYEYVTGKKRVLVS
jgi:type I restriction enzyme S subunit